MIRTIILSVLLTPALPAMAQTNPPPVKLILVQQSTRTIHDVTKRLDGKASVVEQTWQKLAEQTKLFNVEIVDDCKLLTPEKLKEAKIVALYTSRDVPLDVDAFTKWIEDGGFFIGTRKRFIQAPERRDLRTTCAANKHICDPKSIAPKVGQASSLSFRCSILENRSPPVVEPPLPPISSAKKHLAPRDAGNQPLASN
jgi:hypothetical protein